MSDPKADQDSDQDTAIRQEAPQIEARVEKTEALIAQINARLDWIEAQLTVQERSPPIEEPPC